MALTALVLDGARVDPERTPGESLIEWQREVAAQLGVLPRHPHTFRELLDGVLRLHRVMRGLGDPLKDGPPDYETSGETAAEGRISLAS
jgi:hypothetical protein